MKSEPLITVAIPVFNGEQYIEMAVVSVLNQTYGNLEILLLDDGSTDRSLEIIKQFHDSRIRVISDGKNQGLTYRLNETVRMARGEVYARMDADDLMVNTRLERQLEYLLNHPECDVVGSVAYVIDGGNKLTGIRGGNPFMEQGFTSILRRGGFMHPTVTGRTAWFRAHPYDTDAERCEDIELWLRTADESHFAQIEEPLLFYREVGNQSAKVEKTSAGYRKILKGMSRTVKPQYRPLVKKQLRQAHVKIWVRRAAHKFGLEKQIVAARSQRLTENQRQAGEAALQQALLGSNRGL
ncbi:glycosyltransferase [Deinococcus antarcticus]|uniref:Glycosyltransferase n=1 Tax=Deinococcus antarcticus TaxID=1298767 RepID=A0ABV8AAH3_9DEIO